MPDSPVPADSSVVRLTITSDGTTIDDTYAILSVEVRNDVNRIPWARLVLVDGDAAEQDFPVSNAATFQPGATIAVSAGYGSGQDEEQIFSGVVIRHGIRAGVGGSRLEVECQDPAVAMTIGRKNAQFTQKTDAAVIRDVVSGYSELSAQVTGGDDVTHDEILQYYCTDWDFVVARAEAAGLLVSADQGTVTVGAPDTGGTAVLAVAFGETLMEFEAEADARTQLTQVSAVAWDPVGQQVTEETASPPTLTSQGDLQASTLAGIVGPSSYRLQTSAPIDSAGLTAWAEARQLRAGLAKIRGHMRFQGHAAAKPGVLMEVSGLGERFSGTVFVTGVEHRLTEGNWTTDARFGLAPEWLTRRPDVVAPPASGWTPGVEGLQIGLVQRVKESPDGEPKIQVSFPILGDDSQLLWARLASIHATQGSGVFFRPDIGDEVVVGFLANDPSAPVILGGLHSKTRAPAESWEADNLVRSVVTPQQLVLRFDDEKKVITLQTPAGNTVILDDDQKSLTVSDGNSNSVTLDSSGIVLKAQKDITIQADGNLNLTATQNISLSATGDLSADGMNVDLSAQTALTAQGTASAELSASGETTVKGAMVMIN